MATLLHLHRARHIPESSIALDQRARDSEGFSAEGEQLVHALGASETVRILRNVGIVAGIFVMCALFVVIARALE